MRVCEDNSSELVKQLVGPLPECWPSGSWRALVEEEVARKLPVPSHVYDNVMQSYPRDCKDLMVEAAGFLPCYIVTCLDMVRLWIQRQAMFIILVDCVLTRGNNVDDGVMCLQLDKAEDMAVCGGSHTFMTRFISQISRNAGPGYKLDLKWHRDAAMTCAWSVVGASHPGWRLDIQDRHVAAGNDRVICPASLFSVLLFIFSVLVLDIVLHGWITSCLPLSQQPYMPLNGSM